ncbi:MAG: hypothetical protein RLZZ367_846 [Bacteroidota bacterium]|jgi:outer membrane protein OmpA-like peptidoglycan-associated protein
MPKHLLFFIVLLYSSTGFTQQPGKYVVYFASGQYNLTYDAILAIEQGIKDNSLKHIDSVKIRAYCDTVGGLLYNDTLAQNRANTVKNYLYERNAYGVFKEVTAFGERMPLNNNSTEKQKALNRRVEILFYAHNYPNKDTTKPTAVIANTIPIATTADTNTIALQKLRSLFSTAEVGNKIRLPNLNFYGSRHFVVKESLPVLDTLAAILRSYPTIEVEIQGYVCCVPVGKEAYDVTERRYNLSSTRAEAIYNDLVKNGIDPKRLKHKGYGSQPMVAEVDDDAKALNRRVEIKILKR